MVTLQQRGLQSSKSLCFHKKGLFRRSSLLHRGHASQGDNVELPDTYGPNDPRRKIVSILVESIQKREHISLTAGEQFLDLVHVDDIVDAFRLAAQRVFSQGEKNSVYSLSSGRLMKLKHIVELLKGLSQDASLIEMGARSYRFREVMTAWNKGTSLPGWSPFRQIRGLPR